MQTYTSELWKGSLAHWPGWRILLFISTFFICPPLWLIFALPLNNKYNKTPIGKVYQTIKLPKTMRHVARGSNAYSQSILVPFYLFESLFNPFWSHLVHFVHFFPIFLFFSCLVSFVSFGPFLFYFSPF